MGNTGRTQKCMKGCWISLQDMLGPSRGQHLLSPIFKNLNISGLLFLINLCGMFSALQLSFLQASWEEFLHLSHAAFPPPGVSFLLFHLPIAFIVVLWFILLSFELRSGHKTAPEERSVPILTWICCIILDRSILGKIMVNLLPVPKFPHH